MTSSFCFKVNSPRLHPQNFAENYATCAKRKALLKISKRLIRIELTLVAWKATVLPLNYRRARHGMYFTRRVKNGQSVVSQIFMLIYSNTPF